MPLGAGKKRTFKLDVRVPACQPPAAALTIGVALFHVDGGTVDCISEGTPRQVGEVSPAA
jgi:hypothetical protein